MRKNFFFIFFTLSLLIIYIFLVSSIDLKYQVDKKEYIVNNFRRFFDLDRSRILALVKQSEQQDTAAMEQLKDEFTAIIKAPEQAIYSIALVDNKGRELLRVENPEKLRTHNTLKTSLFYRNFSGLYSFGEDTLDFSVECTYTTPKDDTYIQEMTSRYWSVILIISPLFLLFYFLIIKYYILPVKRVVNSLLLIPGKKNVLVPSPLTLLEKSFNLVGLYYQLLSFTNTMYEEIFSRKSLRNEIELEKRVIDIIPQFFPCQKVLCFHLPLSDALHLPETGLIELKDLPEGLQHPQMKDLDHLPLAVLKVSLKDEIIFFFLSFREKNPRLMSFNFEEFLQRFEHILYLTFNYTRLKSAEIIEEKQRANVNLVRNLGHDLTNILATLKLEIANLSFHLHNIHQEETTSSENETRNLLKRVKQNARFLQDIVDVYRALGYMEDPQYEDIEPGKILEHTFQLFKHATSQKIQWLLHASQEKNIIKAEPRLLQLALFNILSNAYDAVKACQSNDYTPCIEAGIEQLKDNGVMIYIQDNGEGIRDNLGNMMTDKQMSAIFEYGYTTKKRGTGEGLGLSWVKTIIEEFHGGKVSVINMPKSGARFEIYLP